MKTKDDLICDVLEAMETMSRWKPVYLAVLKQTKDRKQAIAAVKYAYRMEQELERKKAS
jgi:hypothetical protein